MVRSQDYLGGCGWGIHLAAPSSAAASKELESEPGKFRPKRVNDNKRQDNRSVLGEKRQPQRRADLLILHSGRTADHQLRYFKRPWLSSPAPPSRFLQ